MIELLLAGVAGFSFACVSIYTILRRTTNRRALPAPQVNMAVQEILFLIELKPQQWNFTHRKEYSSGNGFYYPYWEFSEEGRDDIQITLERDYKTIRHIWKPAVIKLTGHEKDRLMDAFRNMVANNISRGTTKLLLEENNG